MDVHPVQTIKNSRLRATITTKITMRAYEVYCHVYSPQKALITGDCRGGFHMTELIAFLYAYPFPKSEWSERVKEAFDGMQNF